MKNLSKLYYLKPVKIIRDSVHGYINLTKFDLELIDTVPFQRLSDVRQLTCQHVYPGARHTRFEHSLGVMELMRNSIKHLNRNRFLGETTSNRGADANLPDAPAGKDAKPLIDESLEFNASVAALLHDVGHCPFSHMGETQFEKGEVRKALVAAVLAYTELDETSDLVNILKKQKKIGAVHEQLSCIVILRKYSGILLNLTHTTEQEADRCEIQVDFELIIRSILGIEYAVKTTAEVEANRLKNVIVRMLNSNIFDVDKLDYIMRDSYLTGIGTPSVDTQRLFRNMYLDDKYSLIFTSKATPALQNMIEARDGLYMYVYNHHAVVYSDFLNTYISRRLSHNAEAFFRAVYPSMSDNELKAELDVVQISEIGLVPKSYMFSVDAVVEKNHSDSTWLSLLNIIHIYYNNLMQSVDEDKIKEEGAGKSEAEIEELRESQVKELLRLRIRGLLQEYPPEPSIPAKDGENDPDSTDKKIAASDDAVEQPPEEPAENLDSDIMEYDDPVREFPRETEDDLVNKIFGAMKLVHQFLSRYYLKPWWKTVFEFTNYMNHNFKTDRIRKLAGKYICDGGDYGLEPDEMRSQIAKHLVYITQRIAEDGKSDQLGLYEKLDDGDFFVVQRSTNFFSKETIQGLEIALKNNEILGTPSDVNRRMNEYYLKTLNNLVPQKEYEAIYDKEGFYVFSKQPCDPSAAGIDTQKKLKRHYKLLEEIFVFVVTSLINNGEQKFVETFVTDRSKEKEKESKEDMYKEFLKGVE